MFLKKKTILALKSDIPLKKQNPSNYSHKWHWCGSICDFISIGIARKQILRVKIFPGDSEEERPRGLGRIWGVKACQGVEKDDGGVTSRFNCLHKTAHTLLTNGNISKRTCFCPFSFRFFYVFHCKVGGNSCSQTALIYDSTST